MPFVRMAVFVLVLLASVLAGCGGGAGGEGAVAQAADPATEDLKVAQGLARPPAKRSWAGHRHHPRQGTRTSRAARARKHPRPCTRAPAPLAIGAARASLAQGAVNRL